MADIVSFGAMHYNTNKFTDLSSLVAPPFDMINPEVAEKLRENPYNFTHLSLPEGSDEEKYRNSMNKIFSWLLRDIMIVDKKPSVYVYKQVIKLDGEVHNRYGLTALMKIEDYGELVKKHENTLPKYVDDRYFLLKESHINLENIYCLYQDNQKMLTSLMENAIAESEAILSANDNDGNIHTVYRVEDEEAIKAMKEFMKSKTVYIADGHHRYEASLKYLKEMKASPEYKDKEAYNYVMVSLFNANEESYRIQPYNRLIANVTKSGVDILKDLEKDYKIAVLAYNDSRLEKVARKKIRNVLSDQKTKGIKSFGIYFQSIPNKYFVLSLKDINKLNGLSLMDTLDSVMLENMVIKPFLSPNADSITYESDDNMTFERVKNGEFSVGLLLNPPDISDILQLSDKNLTLPVKSTLFYPKILSGLTVYSMKYSPIKD